MSLIHPRPGRLPLAACYMYMREYWEQANQVRYHFISGHTAKVAALRRSSGNKRRGSRVARAPRSSQDSLGPNRLVPENFKDFSGQCTYQNADREMKLDADAAFIPKSHKVC